MRFILVRIAQTELGSGGGPALICGLRPARLIKLSVRLSLALANGDRERRSQPTSIATQLAKAVLSESSTKQGRATFGRSLHETVGPTMDRRSKAIRADEAFEGAGDFRKKEEDLRTGKRQSYPQPKTSTAPSSEETNSVASAKTSTTEPSGPSNDGDSRAIASEEITVTAAHEETYRQGRPTPSAHRFFGSTPTCRHRTPI